MRVSKAGHSDALNVKDISIDILNLFKMVSKFSAYYAELIT
jgi:hypothetical protein